MNELQQLAPGQTYPETIINENLETVGAAGIFGKRHAATTGLTWAYYGGYLSSTLIANGTVTLTNTATNYVVVARATGVVSVSTSNTNWNDTTNYGRLYLLTVAGGVVTAEQDHRFGATGIVAAATGASAGGVTLDATYVSDQSSTTDADPGAGNLRWNNATPTSATQLYIDDATADGVDLSTYFASLGDSGFIKIMAAADEWQLWKWTAAPTDGTGYWKFSVTLQASLGTIDALDDIKVSFDDHGTAGAGGGASSVLTFTSDTGSTADSDPGAGLFKWDNATQASSTFLYFDDATLDSVNLDTFYTSQGSSGFISLQQSDDPTKWQLWKWTAAPTDGTGYWKFAVTLQASGGSIADNKTVYVVFMGAGGGGGSTDTVVGTTGSPGGAATVTGGTSTGSTQAGGTVSITGGTPGSTGNSTGGPVAIQGGAGGAAAGSGGAVTVRGGHATITAYSGGALNLSGGNGLGSGGGGGNVVITGGAGTSISTNGSVSITGGGTGNSGGGITIASGATNSSNVSAVAISTPAPPNGASGGAITLTTGASASSGATPGAITLTTGACGGSSGSAGGAITLTTGAGTATNKPGGALTLTSGAGNGTAAGGDIKLTAGAGGGSGRRGNIVLDGGGGGALATTATGGFVYIPTCAGTPTGVPTNIPTGMVPMVFDTTGVKFWIYTGGAWKGVVVA